MTIMDEVEIRPDGRFFLPAPYTGWSTIDQPEALTLDGEYTVADLEAMVTYIRSMEAKRCAT